MNIVWIVTNLYFTTQTVNSAGENGNPLAVSEIVTFDNKIDGFGLQDIEKR